ncbi:hypothetical protein E2C01_005362 [Portunus trituberculatus]|uniref:Uncharacterized protein n=1 Tax=Portunus trituberculatus TaxID=210409 RepID=A0A5B7CT58_PORTR|nr:hypothetical protein [Portunus trituberculatus]
MNNINFLSGILTIQFVFFLVSSLVTFISLYSANIRKHSITQVSSMLYIFWKLIVLFFILTGMSPPAGTFEGEKYRSRRTFKNLLFLLMASR